MPGQADRQTDRHTDRQTDRKTERQTDRQTYCLDRQTDEQLITIMIKDLIAVKKGRA